MSHGNDGSAAPLDLAFGTMREVTHNTGTKRKERYLITMITAQKPWKIVVCRFQLYKITHGEAAKLHQRARLFLCPTTAAYLISHSNL